MNFHFNRQSETVAFSFAAYDLEESGAEAVAV